MRIVFFGTPELAVPSLAAVAQEHEVLAVVCQPDRPKGRSKKLIAPPVKLWALEHGIDVAQPIKLNDGAFESWLKAHNPDVCCLTAYGRILKQPILDVPRHGFINVHTSLLPKLRGPSPIQSAIMLGEKETGVTIMSLDAGMDTGDIVLQKSCPIEDDDTAVTLGLRLAKMGAAGLVEALRLLERGDMPLTAQDASLVTVCRLFSKKDGRLHWAATAKEIHNMVRAAQPWPVAHCLFKGDVCRIHKTEVVDDDSNAEPGIIVSVEKDRILVSTGAGQIAINVYQAPGKKTMLMSDYLRGASMNPGDRFEDILDA